MKFQKTIATLLVAASVAGCTTQPRIAEIKPTVDEKATAAHGLLQAQGHERESYVSHANESWLPIKKVEDIDPSSPGRRAVDTIVDANEQFKDLATLAAEMSNRTGIPITIDADVQLLAVAQMAASRSGVGAVAGAVAPMASPMPSPVPGAPLMGSTGSNAQQSTGLVNAASPYRARYSGALSGFMDISAAYYGLSWRVQRNALNFYLLETKSFRIRALPGDTKLSASVGTAASGSSATVSAQAGSSSSVTGVSFDGLSVWKALESSVAQLLTPTVGKAYVSPATGTITVKDTPASMARIAAFIGEQNEALSRQVAVNVRVLSVELNDSEEYGINWDAVYQNVAAAAGLSVKTAFNVSSGAANMVFSVPSSSTSMWGGSQAIFSALSTQGRVAELTSATMLTTNNQPAPVNVGRRVSYLASSTTTTTASVGSSVSLTPGTVDTGFSMTLVPHILDQDEMMLQYSMDLSSLLRMNDIVSGTSKIQAPDISTSNFIQRIRMNSGETLVVAGFDQSNLSAVANGVGAPENVLFGSRNKANKRTMLVILVQPVIAPKAAVASR